MNVSITKNPGLGFSVAGGIGLQGNPYRPQDEVSTYKCCVELWHPVMKHNRVAQLHENSFSDQGIVYLPRNGNSATFLSYVCNAKRIKELFHPT